jgi:hypothetical protein
LKNRKLSRDDVAIGRQERERSNKRLLRSCDLVDCSLGLFLSVAEAGWYWTRSTIVVVVSDLH